MMTRNRITKVLLTFLFGCSSLLAAQAQSIIFSSPDDLKQWVNVIDDSIPVSIQTLSDQNGSYIRITPATNVYIGKPSSQTMANAITLPALIPASTQNAIKLRLRQTTAFQNLCGFWLHQTTFFDGEHYQQVPFFSPQPLPNDGTWHELIFNFTDSPFFDAQSDVIAVNFGFFNPGFQDLTATNRLSGQTPPGAYIDLQQIAFLSVPQTISQPVITGFTPSRARYHQSVTIAGSGFSQPAATNAVFFGNEQATILSGSATALTVQAEADGLISVRAAGGNTSTSTDSFVLLGPPKALQVISGDGQTSTVGSTLQPFVVKVVDASGNGLPGETITFSVVSGNGLLSSTTGTTDDSGVASTVLTLPKNPGRVRIDAQHPELSASIIFTSNATQP
ncbi:MAG TPA: Ig-like domain-containing protein [Candidatus Angelobacter sp.]